MVEKRNKQTVLDLADLKGKTAVVTGGGGHLGSKMNEALLELGAEVIVVGQHAEKIVPLAKRFPNRVSFVSADLNDKASVLSLREKLPATLHICVNNAYTWPTQVHFEKADWDAVEKTLVSGILSPIFVSQIAFEKMTEGGSIISIASMYGMVSPDFRMYRDSGMGNAIEYGAAKAAIIQMTRYLAVKGAPKGIRVNAISPGPFSKPGVFDNGKEWFREELNAKVPLGRIGENRELKGAIAFLASDLSSYMTGQNLVVDGGWTVW